MNKQTHMFGYRNINLLCRNLYSPASERIRILGRYPGVWKFRICLQTLCDRNGNMFMTSCCTQFTTIPLHKLLSFHFLVWVCMYIYMRTVSYFLNNLYWHLNNTACYLAYPINFKIKLWMQFLLCKFNTKIRGLIPNLFTTFCLYHALLQN